MSVAPSQSYFALGIVALNSVMQSVSAGAKMYTTITFNIQEGKPATQRSRLIVVTLLPCARICTRQQTLFVAATGSCQSTHLQAVPGRTQRLWQENASQSLLNIQQAPDPLTSASIVTTVSRCPKHCSAQSPNTVSRQQEALLHAHMHTCHRAEMP